MLLFGHSPTDGNVSVTACLHNISFFCFGDLGLILKAKRI